MQKYIEAVRELALELAGKAGIHHITIYHDDDCPALSGGDCNCDFKIGTPVEREVGGS